MKCLIAILFIGLIEVLISIISIAFINHKINKTELSDYETNQKRRRKGDE